MEVFRFRITGLSPILQNNPAKMQNGSSSGLKSGRRQYSPEDEAESGVYRNERGEIYVPTHAFRAALFKASVSRKIGKASAKTIVGAAVFPVETNCVLLSKSTGKPIKKYEVHSTRAVVQRAGVIRSRPMISDWVCDLALEIDTEMLPDPKLVEQLLNIAGKVAGLLDWRPGVGGIFGRFEAQLLK